VLSVEFIGGKLDPRSLDPARDRFHGNDPASPEGLRRARHGPALTLGALKNKNPHRAGWGLNNWISAFAGMTKAVVVPTTPPHEWRTSLE
jgi:hypothetical protein